VIRTILSTCFLLPVGIVIMTIEAGDKLVRRMRKWEHRG
jgi:hypothetical protein